MFKSQQSVEAEKQGTLFKKKRREMTTAEKVTKSIYSKNISRESFKVEEEVLSFEVLKF